MNLGAPKKILIKTYAHESGLWYLGLSLYKKLIKDGHQVMFIPKSKFIKRERRYVRTYLEGIVDHRKLFYQFKSGLSSGSQIVDAARDYDADLIISMETMMESSRWINEVKIKTGVKIIDIPMIEWVSPSKIKNGSYKIFDEIWAITDQSYDIFYKNDLLVYKNSWDFVDRELFFEDNRATKSKVFSFYHQASLNPSHTTKNTSLVIKAFELLNNKVSDVKLLITGNIDDANSKKTIDRHTNIITYGNLLSRNDIANLYKITDCVVAPSSKEGLGLSLFEANASGCLVVTTDAPPMNSHETKYLCEVSSFSEDGSLIPHANMTVDSIYKQMKRVYDNEHTR